MKTGLLSVLSVGVLAAAMLPLSSGCSWSVGGSKGNSSCVPAQPTRGQELIDLKKAHDTGAISDAEYENTKQRMLQQQPLKLSVEATGKKLWNSPEATCLAQNKGCVHPAFSIGEWALGMQFHLESTPGSVEALVQNCPGDLVPGRFVQDSHAILSAHNHFRESNRLMTALLDQFLITP